MLLGKVVPIETSPGRVEKIVTVPQAAETLLAWPGKTTDTAKHRAARRAVLAALERQHSHIAAKKAADALEVAAKEAGILR